MASSSPSPFPQNPHTARSSSSKSPPLSSGSHSSTRMHSCAPTLGVPSLLPYPTGLIDQGCLFTALTQSVASNTGVPVGSTPRGFFRNPSAVAATFIMASIELALLVLMLFLCHRRYRIKKEQHVRALNMRISQPHSRGNPFLVDPFAYTSPRCSIGTVSRQNSLKKQPFLRATDELVMDHTENGFSTQGFNEQQKDIWDDTPDEIKNPHLVEINLGATVGRRDRDPEDHSVRQPYRPKPRQTPHGDGTTGRTRALVIAPSRAYHPSPGWRRIDEIPSPAYLDILSVAEDDESDHQLPTPTSITHPKAAICPDRIYSRDASTNKPWPYGISVDPEDCMTTTSCSEDDCDRLAIARQRPPFDGLRQSSPPPRPPKSPLRRAESIRAMPDIRESQVE